ncbi:hypothetical protein [Kitasatospora cineracea]|uniref:Uncharacterized protein n=1 Tax=Kitasatospora cineracea TaxID=88074 RepID=A0A8G1UM88_9ACTN|nr:hypothetical protein [Kitasatospora cineracea]ROR46675.1 hypothetical protein EDD39_4959 [Kitasatospora cineracea]
MHRAPARHDRCTLRARATALRDRVAFADVALTVPGAPAEPVAHATAGYAFPG